MAHHRRRCKTRMLACLWTILSTLPCTLGWVILPTKSISRISPCCKIQAVPSHGADDELWELYQQVAEQDPEWYQEYVVDILGKDFVPAVANGKSTFKSFSVTSNVETNESDAETNESNDKEETTLKVSSGNEEEEETKENKAKEEAIKGDEGNVTTVVLDSEPEPIIPTAGPTESENEDAKETQSIFRLPNYRISNESNTTDADEMPATEVEPEKQPSAAVDYKISQDEVLTSGTRADDTKESEKQPPENEVVTQIKEPTLLKKASDTARVTDGIAESIKIWADQEDSSQAPSDMRKQIPDDSGDSKRTQPEMETIDKHEKAGEENGAQDEDQVAKDVAVKDSSTKEAQEPTKRVVPVSTSKEKNEDDDGLGDHRQYSVVYRDLYTGNLQSTNLMSVTKLGYTASEIPYLQPDALALIVLDEIRKPARGIPQQWKISQSQYEVLSDDVRIVPHETAKELLDAASEKQKSKARDRRVLRTDDDSSLDDDVEGDDGHWESSPEKTSTTGWAAPRAAKRQPERSQRPPSASSEVRRPRRDTSSPSPRQRQGRSERSKRIYNVRGGPDKVASREDDPPPPKFPLWKDMDTFRDLLRSEAELRVRILGDGWADAVKSECNWRLGMYKEWLKMLDSGIGDSPVPSRSERMRQSNAPRRPRNNVDKGKRGNVAEKKTQSSEAGRRRRKSGGDDDFGQTTIRDPVGRREVSEESGRTSNAKVTGEVYLDDADVNRKVPSRTVENDVPESESPRRKRPIDAGFRDERPDWRRSGVSTDSEYDAPKPNRREQSMATSEENYEDLDPFEDLDLFRQRRRPTRYDTTTQSSAGQRPVPNDYDDIDERDYEDVLPGRRRGAWREEEEDEEYRPRARRPRREARRRMPRDYNETE